MTKKFWADWQKRVGETIQVRIYSGYSWSGYALAHSLLNTSDRIIKASFHGDAVDLIIETHNLTLKGTTHIENKYVTVHRNEIKNVEFIKY